MAVPLTLSGSSLNTYLRCGKQWEYAYVQRLKRPPTLKLALGSAAHTTVEIDLKNKLRTGEDLPREQVTETFRDEFVKEAEDAEDSGRDTKSGMLDSGIKTVGFWHDEVAPITHPAMVEEEIQFRLLTDRMPEGVVITGTIDNVDTSDVVADWKFTSRTPAKGDGSYLLNMTTYAIGFRKKTGRVEKGVRLDHLVRLKKPKHVPVESGPVPDQSIRAYAEIVTDVAKGIQAGFFPATGLKSQACSWCGYRDICPAFRAVNGGRNA